MIGRALGVGNFVVTPDFGSLSHLKYIYDPPKSHIADVAVETVSGVITSADIFPIGRPLSHRSSTRR
jgi:hypothetical protein